MYIQNLLNSLDYGQLLFHFCMPVWKTVVLSCGDVHSYVHLSFPDFSTTCFDISIWNLAYTFGRWHHTVSLSFLTTRLLWPTSQPKVGQIHFIVFMALKKQDKSFRFCTEIPFCRCLNTNTVYCKNLILEFCFPYSLQHFIYKFQTYNVHFVGAMTHRGWVLMQSSGHLGLF